MLIAGMEVELVRKDIKNLHLAVYPPDGRIRLAAPNGGECNHLGVVRHFQAPLDS
jgi:hypothetical protein